MELYTASYTVSCHFLIFVTLQYATVPYQDCHLHLRRLRKVISRNLQGADDDKRSVAKRCMVRRCTLGPGLQHLKRLQNVVENAQKVLGEKRRRPRGQKRNQNVKKDVKKDTDKMWFKEFFSS